MFNHATAIFIQTYIIVCLVIYGIWGITAAIWYIKALPEKRKTCHELFIIRMRKEESNGKKENIC